MSLRLSIATCILGFWALLLSGPATSQDTPSAQVVWSDLEIGQWASANSPLAQLYQAESAASSASIDRDDRSQCAQANLIQRVLADLACYERHQAAIQAIKNAAQIRGLEHQRKLLIQSLQTFDELIQLAEKAERLELHEGNPLSLRRERLAVEDQLEQAEAGIAKSRILLSQQVGKPIAEAESVTLEGESPRLLFATRDDAYLATVEKRCDLQAIRHLCASLNLDTLPAARQAFAMLQPGLGLSINPIARKVLLASLHTPSPPSAELCRRREECQALQAMREQQAQAELFATWVEVQSNQHRLRIDQQRIQLSQQLQRQSVEAIAFDQGVPGADLQTTLEQLQAEIQLIQQQTLLNASILELYRLVGAMPEA